MSNHIKVFGEVCLKSFGLKLIIFQSLKYLKNWTLWTIT